MTTTTDAPTPSSTTRELLGYLTDEYNSRGPGLAQMRLVMETWADEFARSTSTQKEVRFTAPDQDTSVQDFLSGMDRAQAGRFLAELFSDMVPHFASQKNFLRGIADGQTDSGMTVKRSGVLARVAGVLGNLPGLNIDAHMSTEVRSLVWVDDDKRTIENQIELDMRTEGEVGPGRKIKF